MASETGRTAEVTELEQPCAGCGSARARRLFPARDRLHHLPGTFWVVRCVGCGLVRTAPRPSGPALAAYYPDTYGPHRETEVPTPEPGDRALRAWLRRWVGTRRIWWTPDLPPGARVLELGSGAGHFVRHARSRGWDIHALEPAREPAERLARELGAHVHHAPAEALDVPRASFDAVFAWMVIEHVEQPRAVLESVAAALKPGGYFVFSVPNAASWEFSWFGDRWYGLDVPRHLWHYSVGTLRPLLRAAGLAIERVYHQKVVKNITGSLEYVAEDRPRVAPLARSLARAISGPRTSFAIGAVLAGLRQGGRLTIATRASGGRDPSIC